MSVNKEIQKVTDQLMYNQLYAPDYPAEDSTTLDREKSRILLWLEHAISSTRREDVGDWLRLGRSSIEEAFAKLKSGERKSGLRSIEFAIQYLRNASTRKSYNVDFIGKRGSVIIVAPPSTTDEQ